MDWRFFLFFFGSIAVLFAQETPVSQPENSFAPTWETQKLARTYLLGIPAPRGQITDRNGSPLAQNRVSYNLAIAFPTPPTFSEPQALAFARQQIRQAQLLTGREITVSDELILKHYKNRGALPLEISFDLLPEEFERVKAQKTPHLMLKPVYLRFYPNGALAGHILGYAGRKGRNPDGPVENNELLWPDLEGREGIEQTFNSQLTGKVGQMNIAFDARGKKSSEHVSIAAQPGYNVVMALDESIQRLAEEVLDKNAKRGAIVILDPNNGDVLAMASKPSYNPNLFVPVISPEDFKKLQEDPAVPLLPRAYRSSYPAGSTFKVIVGLAALESGKITPVDEFSCPTAFYLGKFTFRNWKKESMGMMNFADALTQSCNTWFYQVGLKTGADAILDWSFRLGLGEKTGIPLNGEMAGRIPTDDYMMKTHGRRILEGDVANLSIGQGDILISPLQMAQAMGAIGNGGTLYQTRLVLQVQTLDDKIATGYDVRPKEFLNIRPETVEELKKAMTAVVSSGMGTASQARVPNIKVAGKTGTAQWGSRTAGWFTGFAPAEQPKYAFAALYEGDPDEDVHGGSHAAPLIGKVLKELFKKEKEKQEKSEEVEEPETVDGD